MQCNIYLQGNLGERFGSCYSVNANNYLDFIKCIQANEPSFRNYLIECAEKGINFAWETDDGEYLSEEDVAMNKDLKNITLFIVPAGSSGAVKAVVGAAMMVAGLIIGGPIGYAILVVGTILANYCMAEMMMPDPAVDDEEENRNYLFDGGQQNIKEGAPVPVLYGNLRVPGLPLSVDASFEGAATQGTTGNSGQNKMAAVNPLNDIDMILYERV